MKKRSIVLISIVSALALMSGGYGKWNRDLVIEGNIELVADPNDIASLESQMINLKSKLEVLKLELEDEEKIIEELAALEEIKLAKGLKEKEKKELEKIDSEIEIDNKLDEEDNDAKDKIEDNYEDKPDIPDVDDSMPETEEIENTEEMDDVDDTENEYKQLK